MDKKLVLDEKTFAKATELLGELFTIPGPWIVVILVFSAISVFDVSQTFGGEEGSSLTLGFGVTATTVLILSLMWLPAILRMIAFFGGKIKTGAGEADTPGLLKTLIELVAVVDSTKDKLDDSQKKEFEQIRAQAEKQIAQSLAPDAEEARKQVVQLAQEYEVTRSRLQKGDYRTRKMNNLVTQVRALSEKAAYSTHEIQTLYRSGSDGQRVAALALLRGHPDAACFELVLDAIGHSRSAFEQYTALRLASELLDILDEADRQKLVSVIEEQTRPGSGHYLRETSPDRSRWRIAQQILNDLKK
jgi:hypothetical protein